MHEQLSRYIRDLIDVNDEQLALLLHYFQPKKVKKHDVLVRAGEISSHINFIAKGCLRIFFIKDDGQESTRYLAFENQFATGLSSFIPGKPSMEYIQALEDSELLRIARNDFYYLLQVIPAWEKFYRKYLEMAYLTNLDIFQRELTKDAEERYRQLLSIDPAVVQRLPNRIVASYLNMSPETLSRIKSRSRKKKEEG